ncbi:MAG: hypothetical protein AAB604_01550, partial [Patescibacteria group bacterium]
FMEEKKMQKHLLRINEALYRVTDLFADQEPVKWTLRKKAMEAFDLFSEDSPLLLLAARMKKREAFAGVLHQLLDLLEFASHNTFISRVNFEVLSREYRAFLQETHATQSATYQEENLFGDLSLFSHQEESQNPPKISSLASPQGGSPLLQKQKKNDIYKKETSPQVGAELTTEERRNHILSFMNQKEGGITMQELSKIFKGALHLRTLQRDLTELITQGKVKTEGERRWRRYSVV